MEKRRIEMILFYTLIFYSTFFICVNSEVTCDKQFLSLTVNEEIVPVSCHSNGVLSSVPILPYGLYIQNNTIYGTPREGSPYKEYLIIDEMSTFSIIIGVYSTPETFSSGSDIIVFYQNTYIHYLLCKSNTIFLEASIEPDLPSGLTYNTTTGYLSGRTEFSSEENIEYTLTGRNNFGSIQCTFSVLYDSIDKVNIDGYTGCYYVDAYPESVLPSEYLFSTSSFDICTRYLKNLDFQDTFSDDPIITHTWRHLDVRFSDIFIVTFNGYLNISQNDEYHFTLYTNDSVNIYIDGELFIHRIQSDESDSDTITKSIFLDIGYHLLFVVFSHSKPYTSPFIRITYTISDLTTVYNLNSSNMVAINQSPQFLSYSPLYTSYNVPFTVYPKIISGLILYYQVDPLFPDEITLDPVYGVISGSLPPKSEGYNTTYTISANGYKSITTYNFTILIEPSLVRGIEGNYYHIKNGEDFNSNSYISSNSILRDISRIDYDINHELSYNTVWEGLPPTFHSFFYVQYDGYLYIQSPATYTFVIYHKDGFKFRLQNNIVYSNWDWLNSYVNNNITVQFNSSGYYSIQFNYFMAMGAYGLQLFYYIDDSSSGTHIPLSIEPLLYHQTSGLLTYAYSSSTYYLHSRITPNIPILFKSLTGTYELLSPLPEGLEFNTQTGIIFGAPNVISADKLYTIIMHTNDTEYSTLYATISICVIYIAPPTNIVVHNSLGQSTTSLSFPMYQFSSYKISATNVVRYWTIIPALPYNVYLNPFRMTIEGNPTEYSSLADYYTLSAYNDGGSTSLNITISLETCSYGYYTQYTASESYPGTVSLFDISTSTLVYNFTDSQNIYVCIPLTRYRLVFVPMVDSIASSNVSNKGYSAIQLSREDELLYFHQYVYYNESKSYIIDLSSLTPLSITEHEHIIKLRVGEVFSLPIHFSSSLPSFYLPVFFPTLLSSVRYNIYTSTIEGTFNEFGDYIYSVTFTNTISIVTVNLFFDVHDFCQETHPLIFHRPIVNTCDELYLYDSSGDLVFSSISSSQTNWTQHICPRDTRYTIKFSTTCQDVSSYEHYLEVQYCSEIIGFYSLSSSTTSIDDEILLIFTLPHYHTIQYYNKNQQIDNNWNYVEYDSSEWSLYSLTSPTYFQDITTYFRIPIIIDDDFIKYNGFIFDFYTTYGFIIYVNGYKIIEEMGLKNIDIDWKTYSNISFNTGTYHKYMLTRSLFHSGENVIALELHRTEKNIIYDTTSCRESNSTIVNMISLQMDVSLFPLLSQCNMRSLQGSFYDNYNNTSLEHIFSSPYDSLYISTNPLPVYVYYTSKDDSYEFINKIRIVHPSSDIYSTIKHFQVEGSNDMTHWTLLLDMNRYNLFIYSRNREFWLDQHSDSYAYYRLAILETNDGGNSFALSIIGFLMCRRSVCAEDNGWYETNYDTTLNRLCSNDTFGIMYRECKEINYVGVWDEVDDSNCLSLEPPFFSVYVGFVLQLINITYIDYTSKARSHIIDILILNLRIDRSNLIVTNGFDCSNDLFSVVCLDLEIQAPWYMGTQLYDSLLYLNSTINDLIYESPPQEFPKTMTILLLNEPKIGSFPYGYYIIFFLVLFIIFLFGLCITGCILFMKYRHPKLQTQSKFIYSQPSRLSFYLKSSINPLVKTEEAPVHLTRHGSKHHERHSFIHKYDSSFSNRSQSHTFELPLL